MNKAGENNCIIYTVHGVHKEQETRRWGLFQAIRFEGNFLPGWSSTQSWGAREIRATCTDTLCSSSRARHHHSISTLSQWGQREPCSPSSSHYRQCGAGRQDETMCYSSAGGDGGVRSHWAILNGEPQEVVTSTFAGVDTVSCPLEVCLP